MQANNNTNTNKKNDDDGDVSGCGDGVGTHSMKVAASLLHSNKMGKMFYVNFKCSIITVFFMENLV